jgi:hypothetical protein
MGSVPSSARLSDPFAPPAPPIACARRPMRAGRLIGVDDPKLLEALVSGDLRSKVLELREAREERNNLEVQLVVSAFRYPLALVAPAARAGQNQSVISLVQQFTKELFGAQASVRRGFDPDFQSSYFIVSIISTAGVDQLVELNHQWHLHIRDVVGEAADQFRLSINVQ